MTGNANRHPERKRRIYYCSKKEWQGTEGVILSASEGSATVMRK